MLFNIEKAKVNWALGEQKLAIDIIKAGADNENIESFSYVSLKCILAEYLAETQFQQTKKIIDDQLKPLLTAPMTSKWAKEIYNSWDNQLEHQHDAPVLKVLKVITKCESLSPHLFFRPNLLSFSFFHS